MGSVQESLVRGLLHLFVVSGAIGALFLTNVIAGSNETIEFGALTSGQQALFHQYQVDTHGSWGNLNSSEQIEFAGATQALSNWCASDPECNSWMATHHQPGLSQVGKVIAINGSIVGSPSPDQFNLTVKWSPGSEDMFKHAWGWGVHPSQLHPGQHGYSQHVANDPWIGIVTLFNNNDPSSGQFHTDFAEAFDHYVPDNGNIAAHYSEFCNWYGRIPSFDMSCGSSELLSSSKLRSEKPGAVSPKLQAPNSESVTAIGADDRAKLRSTVTDFLQTWYVKRDYDGAAKFIAKDNAFASSDVRTEMQLAPVDRPWRRIFDESFHESSEHIESLRAAIGYSRPDADNSPQTMTYMNANPAGEISDPFAIIDPESTPPGSFFPRLDLSAKQRERSDARAKFLDHLQRDYKGRLSIVVYSTKGSALLHETVVQYWIKEGGSWRLAAFQGIA